MKPILSFSQKAVRGVLIAGTIISSGCTQTDTLPRGQPPGVVINQTPSPSGRFIGSPSVLILPSGDYLASHDWFGPEATKPGSTQVFRSVDRGSSWSPVAKVPHVHFATLFNHNGAVYLLGTSINRSPGYISIHRSYDNGVTWTKAEDLRTGRLFTAETDGGFHGAPTPVLVAGGRVWRAFEERTDSEPPSHAQLRTLMISAPTDADLLDSSSWTRTNSLAFDPVWLNARRPGWLEGNAVQAPDGGVVNILRTDVFRGPDPDAELKGAAAGIPRYELGALVRVNGSDKLSFSPEAGGWIHLPGGSCKFTIRFDPLSARYWSIVNKITGEAEYGTQTFNRSPPMQRNVLALISSADLRIWTEHCRLLRWREGEVITQTDRTGFQYVDWQFDGADIVYVVRTGWDAKRAHDANYLTFHRAVSFRTLTAADAPPDLAH